MFHKERGFVMNIAHELDALFKAWMNKPIHSNDLFNRDGIVNLKNWEDQEKKILFIFKEAWHKNEITGRYDLAEDLNSNKPWGMWNRVAEWTKAIHETETNRLACYKELDYNEKHELIKKVAVMNIKKSGGRSTSNDEDLKKYVTDDYEEIKKQIHIINPNIIVCGNTLKFIKPMLLSQDTPRNQNWYYWNSEDQLILDYYHPANQYPSLLNFYGLASIYYQAINNRSR